MLRLRWTGTVFCTVQWRRWPQIAYRLWFGTQPMFCWTSQLWRATPSLCSSRGRNTEKMQTSSFPSPSSAASGPWQIPPSGLGEWNVPYWALQSVCFLLISSSSLLCRTFRLTVVIHSHPSEQETGPLPLQLVEAFGLVIQCRDSVGKHSLLSQTIHTLKQAVQPGKPLYSSCLQFSTQDYKEVQKHTQLYQRCIFFVLHHSVYDVSWLPSSLLMHRIYKWRSALRQKK